MRLYLIVNSYSIGIQAGIQGAHVIPELYEKYLNTDVWCPTYLERLREWAQRGKTIVVLKGPGGNDEMETLYEDLSYLARAEKLPYALFREGALRNSCTAIGIVVPWRAPNGESKEMEELRDRLAEMRTAT